MNEQQHNDWNALLELLLFPPAAFLVAWFLAGFTISQLGDLIWLTFSLVPAAVQFAGGIILGAIFIWTVARATNWNDRRRQMTRGLPRR